MSISIIIRFYQWRIYLEKYENKFVLRLYAGGERIPGRGTPDTVSDQRHTDTAQRGDENAQVGGGWGVGGWRQMAFAKRSGKCRQFGYLHQL